MSDTDAAAMDGSSMFDNVFVNPQAYREFERTGTWPDHTLLVLESRGGSTKGSINQRGIARQKRPWHRGTSLK